jgi:hypothetical protein
MSKEMKLIMENWRGSILQEQHAIELHEQLINEFVLDLKQIQESSNDINEVLSKVSEFAKKAYNTYKDIKNNTIQAVLTKAIDSAMKVLNLIEDSMKEKAPALISKIKSVLEKLKEESNMAIAVSVVSVLIGLMTGEAFDVLGTVLDILDASDNIMAAYETISKITDSADVKRIVNKAGQLVSTVT